MKKGIIILLYIIQIFCILTLSACTDKEPAETATGDTAVAESRLPSTENAVSQTTAVETASPTVSEGGNKSEPATESMSFDPYATENRYDVPASMFERYSNVDYGRLDKDVTYYSTVAGDNKQVNVLLPAGYDENQTYPVMYVVHGFDADHNAHVGSDTYLTLLYGNMLDQGLTVPMILVGIDMYTDKLADKDSKSYEELRYIYDKCIDEIKIDLMPFMEQHYPVSTERKDTAVAGVSEGGAKSLCIGFKWLDEFGWIGGFAPDANVIPTGSGEWESYWTDPYMQEFPQPNESKTPYYLYMAVGSEDPWCIDCTLLYRDTLNNMGVKNQTDYVEGYGHNTEFWG